MKKNSGVRIKALRYRGLANASLRDAKSVACNSYRVRYKSGIQTGAGIVAPPNFQFGGATKPIIHPPMNLIVPDYLPYLVVVLSKIK
ncbi:hypothetical protein A4S05_36490 [Nostoc sp. KVJ20]|uniref:hypothetical protein n=1 Tax=unclassified Nostoc TaxID=2593658 RepID=UPI00083CE4CB|nr:hypothetical protein [Nostoc sp. KVJ20]ODG99761.1 hypothetical protein A4S05_36490 [Nostoc sp. KVJ20]